MRFDSLYIRPTMLLAWYTYNHFLNYHFKIALQLMWTAPQFKQDFQLAKVIVGVQFMASIGA